MTQQAEAELSRGLQEAARLVEQYHRDAARDRGRARLARGRPAQAQGGGRRGRPAHRRAGGARLPRARALGRAWCSPTAGAGPSSRSARTPRPGRASRSPSAWPATGCWRRSRPRYSWGGEAPEVLGHLTLGFALDDAFAVRLRALTGSHVAVAAGGRVFASTLPRRHDRRPGRGGRGRGRRPAEPRRRGPRRPLRASLGPGGGSPFVVVLRVRARRPCRPLRTLRAALLVAALAAVGVGLLLSWALARTVTRPLRGPHRRHEGDRRDRRPGAAARPRQPVGRRGRPPRGPDLRRPHRLDRPLPAGGRACASGSPPSGGCPR